MSDPLVILPGLLCDSRMFGAQVAAFDAQVIDGFYGEAASLTAMAHHALERMPPRAAVLGHSMGGRVALELWRIAPDRISRLALADTGVHPVRPGEADSRHALRDLALAQGAQVLVDRWLPPMIGPACRGDAALRARLEAMVRNAGPQVFARHTQALLTRPEAEGVLATITCPTIAIVGQDDTWAPVEQHARMVAAVPDAQLRIIAQAGHMAPAENPQHFNQAMREWLAWPSRNNNPGN